MDNPKIVELENECLRNRLKDVKTASSALVTAVEKYVRQECLRTELLRTKEHLKEVLR